MAATFSSASKDGKAPSAPSFTGKVHVAGDASYPTGGYAFDPADELEIPGLTVQAAFIDPGSKEGAFAEHEAVYDAENGKLKIMFNDGGTLAEVANETDLSGFEFDLLIYGY